MRNIEKNIPRRSGKKAFTMLEIIIVMVILAVLVTFALPQLGAVMEHYKATEAEGTLMSLMSAQLRYELENGNYADDVTLLAVQPRTSEYFENLLVFDNAANLVQMDRVDIGYRLSINSTGTISCSNGPGICQKIGY